LLAKPKSAIGITLHNLSDKNVLRGNSLNVESEGIFRKKNEFGIKKKISGVDPSCIGMTESYNKPFSIPRSTNIPRGYYLKSSL
jgi:hypothetical protein